MNKPTPKSATQIIEDQEKKKKLKESEAEEKEKHLKKVRTDNAAKARVSKDKITKKKKSKELKQEINKKKRAEQKQKRENRIRITKSSINEVRRPDCRLDASGEVIYSDTLCMETYKSAHLELERNGYLTILESFLWLERDKFGTLILNNLDGMYTMSHTELLKTRASTIALWSAPAYKNGNELKVYLIPPPPEALENNEKLQVEIDQNWHKIVERAEIQNTTKLHPYTSAITSLVHALGIDFDASGMLGFPASTEDFNQNIYHYDPNQKNPQHTAQLLVTEKIRELGLLDSDIDYGDLDCLYPQHEDMNLPDHLGDLKLHTQDMCTLEEAPERLNRRDPRTIWRDFNLLTNEDISCLRESIQELIYLSYLAGKEEKNNELNHTTFSRLQASAVFDNAKPKAGETQKKHTSLLQEATKDYVKSSINGDPYFMPTAAKVRDHILKCNNKAWSKALEDSSPNSLKGVVQRYREKVNKDKIASEK